MPVPEALASKIPTRSPCPECGAGGDLTLKAVRKTLLEVMGIGKEENHIMVVGLIVCEKDEEEQIEQLFDSATDADALGAGLTIFLRLGFGGGGSD